MVSMCTLCCASLRCRFYDKLLTSASILNVRIWAKVAVMEKCRIYPFPDKIFTDFSWGKLAFASFRMVAGNKRGN